MYDNRFGFIVFRCKINQYYGKIIDRNEKILILGLQHILVEIARFVGKIRN